MNVSWSDFALRDLKQFSELEARALKVQVEDVLNVFPFEAGETIHIPYDRDYIVVCHRYASPPVISVLRILYSENDIG